VRSRARSSAATAARRIRSRSGTCTSRPTASTARSAITSSSGSPGRRRSRPTCAGRSRARSSSGGVSSTTSRRQSTPDDGLRRPAGLREYRRMAQTAQLRRIDVADNEAQRVFRLQREAYLRHPYPSYEERQENLGKLERVLVDNATAIAEAIHAD